MSALHILFMTLPFLVMLGVGLLLPILLVLCYSRFGFGLVVIAGMFLIDALLMYGGGLHLGINLFYTDFALVLIGAAAALRLVFAPDFPLRHVAWLVFCAMICLSLALGLASYGTAAGVSVRGYFYFMVAGLYGMSFPMDEPRVRFTLNVMVAVAVLLMGLTVYRWVVYYTPITALLPEGGSYNVDGPIRVIKSNEALILGQVLVGGLFFALAASWLFVMRWLSPFLLGMVLALQHRSVWLAMLVGGLTRFLVVRSKQSSTASQLLLMVAIVGITSIPLVFSEKMSGLTEQVQHSAERALEGRDTTGERFSNWKALIQLWYQGGAKSIVIGQSFGADSTRYVEDDRGSTKKITYFAHNLYVQTLYNTGLVGLSAMVLAFFYVVLGLYRLNRDGVGGMTTQVLLVLVVMQMAYYVPYGTDYLQGLLFGVALAYVAAHQPARASAGRKDGLPVQGMGPSA
jgi:hypothetical protein